jgi:hypothetical protein
VGHPTHRVSGNDTFISLWVDRVKVSGTGNLDPVLEFIGQQMLNALLTKLQLSAKAMTQGAFGLKLEDGPEISDNQLKIWGGIA